MLGQLARILAQPCGFYRLGLERGPASNQVADLNGNPVMVSGVVSFRVINSKAAALDVENAKGYVHTQVIFSA